MDSVLVDNWYILGNFVASGWSPNQISSQESVLVPFPTSSRVGVVDKGWIWEMVFQGRQVSSGSSCKDIPNILVTSWIPFITLCHKEFGSQKKFREYDTWWKVYGLSDFIYPWLVSFL